MKRIALAAVAVAALGFATAASAEGEGHYGEAHKTFHIHGFVPARCEIEARRTWVRLDRDDIVNRDAFVHKDLADHIAHHLNELGVHAWCNGNHNGVNLTRTALVNRWHQGAAGPGSQDAQGFDNAAIYDISMTIDGAVRKDGVSPLEGTEDGHVGPGFHSKHDSVSDFGPHHGGALIHFANDAANNGLAGSAASAEAKGPRDDGADADFTTDTGTRLAAGEYDGEVHLRIVPRI